MPQNLRDSDGIESNEGAAAGAAAFERLRNMLLVPPANRPPDWVNPLEKIEQLLTCAVCLDRYKNPKLLPCQHTFCMEPCLDGLIDLVRRMVRCPECRAEHPLPYDGLKAYQTNYTLMGFLEVHVQATEDNAGDLESYIRRYNLERCKICDEKAEVDYCPHCDKRICLECKTTHADMLKRDLGRLMNQVKRATSRITDSSETLGRGVESLNVNCENVKEEVKDYMRRYVKELKKREETLVNEVETFYTGETRMINTVRDNLELDAKNMNEACARVESCLKGEKELTDEELVRYKQMFTDGLDYLRMANPDADELINKKIRFVITDAHVLPHAILQFGELQVCTPQFNHKFVHAEKMYVPRFLQMGLESENYPGKKKAEESTAGASSAGATAAASERSGASGTSSGWKAQRASATAADEDAYSSRYRRRQQLEEQAWNRIRVEQEQQGDNRGQSSSSGQQMRRSPRASALDDMLSGTSPSRATATTLDAANSPWSRPHRAASDLAPESLAPAAAAAANNSSGESPSPSPNVLSPQMPRVVRAPAAVAAAAAAEARAQRTTTTAAPAAEAPSTSGRRGSSKERELDRQVANIRKEHEHRQQEQSGATPTTRPAPPNRNRTNPMAIPTAAAAVIVSEDEEEEENEDESDPIAVQVFPKPKPAQEAQTKPLQVDTSNGDASSSRGHHELAPTNGADWRKYLIPSPEFRSNNNGNGSGSAVGRRSSTVDPPMTTGAPASAIATTRPEIRNSSSNESISDQHEDRRRHFIRSRTNPDFVVESNSTSPPKVGSPPSITNAPIGDSDRRHHRYRTDSLGSQGSQDESSSPQRTRNDRDAEQRKNRYRRKAERSHSAFVGVGGTGEDPLDPYVGMDGRITDAAQRFEMTVQGEAGAPRHYRNYTQPKIDYLMKGRCAGKFGAKGNGEGQFNWPRGIAIVSGTDEIAVCDSSNHRMQIFDKRGRFLRTLGSYGSARGEFDCLADVCVNKYRQFVVTDRYNHRVQIFDEKGRHLREFGSHGQTNGRFNSPWGVCVDQQGFIYVCDKDNHRVQIFQSDGNFVGKFGAMGNRDGQFQNPHFIACTPRQNQLIVSDSGNHRVQVFDHNGHYLFAFGSEGFHEGQFKYPRGVAVDEQGFIVVADSGNNRVQVFYPDGRFYASFGAWGTGDGQLKGVEGVAVAPDGKIFVTDRENHRVQIF